MEMKEMDNFQMNDSREGNDEFEFMNDDRMDVAMEIKQ
jgi:hypothetical protein